MTVLDPTAELDLVVENERLRRRVEQLESYLTGMVDIGLIALASASAPPPEPPSPDER